MQEVNKKKKGPAPGTEAVPWSLSIEGAACHFGIAAQTIKNMICSGRVVRGKEYIKYGKKPLIVRQGFIDFLKREDGSSV